MVKLSTHVLDTAHGCPAAGVRIELDRLDAAERRALVDDVTDGDGRCVLTPDGAPVLKAGEYELSFHVGAYFADHGPSAPTIKFLDVVPVRFHVADGQRYHVPLLISPFGYSTYRGS